jgi:hypothetical protein
MQAVHSSMMAFLPGYFLEAASSPEKFFFRGGWAGERATGTAGPGSNEFGLARLRAAGPERAQRIRTQAEATRNEQHRESEERQQRRGRKDENGETGDDKCRRPDPMVVVRSGTSPEKGGRKGGKGDPGSHRVVANQGSAAPTAERQRGWLVLVIQPKRRRRTCSSTAYNALRTVMTGIAAQEGRGAQGELYSAAQAHAETGGGGWRPGGAASMRIAAMAPTGQTAAWLIGPGPPRSADGSAGRRAAPQRPTRRVR